MNSYPSTADYNSNNNHSNSAWPYYNNDGSSGQSHRGSSSAIGPKTPFQNNTNNSYRKKSKLMPRPVFRSIRYAIEDHVRNFTAYSQNADFVAWEDMSEVRLMAGSTYLQMYLLISDQLNVLPCDLRLWICEVPNNSNNNNACNNYDSNNYDDHTYNMYPSSGSGSGSKVSFHDPYNDHPPNEQAYSHHNNWGDNYEVGGDGGNNYDLGDGGGGGGGVSNMGDTLRISDPLDFHSMCDQVCNKQQLTNNNQHSTNNKQQSTRHDDNIKIMLLIETHFTITYFIPYKSLSHPLSLSLSP